MGNKNYDVWALRIKEALGSGSEGLPSLEKE
jgi:hypothetical protein